MWRWRQRSGWLIYKPRSTNHCSWPPEAEREAQDRVNSQKDPPLLTGWSWTPASRTLREDTFCCLSHPVSGTLLWQPRKVNKLSKVYGQMVAITYSWGLLLVLESFEPTLMNLSISHNFQFPLKNQQLWPFWFQKSEKNLSSRPFLLSHSSLDRVPLGRPQILQPAQSCWRTCVI